MSIITILGTGLARAKKPGMTIPAVVLFEELEKYRTEHTIQLIGLDNSSQIRYKRSQILSSDIVIINSLSTLLQDGSELLLELLASKKVFLYLHETEYVIDYSINTHSHKMSIFWRALPYIGILCSTQRQQAFYQNLGLDKSAVIYNSLRFSSAYSWGRQRCVSSEIRVIMIGSIQMRKGPALFDQVANMLTTSDPRFKFTWIGGKTDREDGNYTFSTCVEWIERIFPDQIEGFFSRSDIFFLSSIDDPLPLSATEAAAAGLRVVAYDATGTHETLFGSLGYTSFSSYAPEHAAAALKESISKFPVRTDYSSAANKFRPEVFATRALNEIFRLTEVLQSFSPNYVLKADNRLHETKNSGSCPLLYAYALPDTSLDGDYSPQFSQLKRSLCLSEVDDLIAEYAVLERSLFGFEIIGIAKLLFIREDYKRCCEFILNRMRSDVSLGSSISITLAALKKLEDTNPHADLIGRWLYPIIQDRLKADSDQRFLYEYAERLFRRLGCSVIADRHLNRARNLMVRQRIL